MKVRLLTPAAFTPRKYSSYTFLLEGESINDTIGNRTRKLPSCSAMYQSTGPPHVIVSVNHGSLSKLYSVQWTSLSLIIISGIVSVTSLYGCTAWLHNIVISSCSHTGVESFVPFSVIVMAYTLHTGPCKCAPTLLCLIKYSFLTKMGHPEFGCSTGWRGADWQISNCHR